MEPVNVVDKCLNEGVVDFGVFYSEVNDNLSKFILQCLITGGDKVFLTIDMNGNYVLMRKSEKDVCNLFISHWFYDIQGFQTITTNGRSVHDCVLNTKQYNTILSKVYKDKSNLIHSLFLSLFETGLSLNDYLTGYSYLGIPYSNIVDDIILSINSLSKSAMNTDSKNLFYLWSQSLTAGFSIVEKRVKLYMGKSYWSEVFEDETREKEEMLRKNQKMYVNQFFEDEDTDVEISPDNPNLIRIATKHLKNGKYIGSKCFGGYDVLDSLPDNYECISEDVIMGYTSGTYYDTYSFAHYVEEKEPNYSKWFKWLNKYPRVKRGLNYVEYGLEAIYELSNWLKGVGFAIGYKDGVFTLYKGLLKK